METPVGWARRNNARNLFRFYRDDLVAQTRNFRQELRNYRGDNDATVVGEVSFFLCADSHPREETIDMQISKKAHRHIRSIPYSRYSYSLQIYQEKYRYCELLSTFESSVTLFRC